MGKSSPGEDLNRGKRRSRFRLHDPAPALSLIVGDADYSARAQVVQAACRPTCTQERHLPGVHFGRQFPWCGRHRRSRGSGIESLLQGHRADDDGQLAREEPGALHRMRLRFEVLEQHVVTGGVHLRIHRIADEVQQVEGGLILIELAEVGVRSTANSGGRDGRPKNAAERFGCPAPL